jgi:asparagine synthase (glutamine-hydrolysing)
MCGIAGFASSAGWKPEQAERVAVEMTRRLVHRGPDASGIWSTDGVFFGHRRLSIIDLSGGVQPMTDPDSGCAITFNGEIYNYLEINTELRSLGADFRTRSDTETILKAYAVWGESCLSHFNGMFAFVLYDARTRKLFGARDRMGKKPFFYYHDGQTLVFGSEPKALLAHPAVSTDIDWEAASRYLLHEYVPAPYAIYRGMRKLPAGHKFRFDLASGVFSEAPYWECRFGAALSDGEANCEDFWVRRLREELNAAVRRRLISDVPLGAFLSGGIDSSAIVAAMVAQQGSARVKTFSIAFDDSTYDESKYARCVAEILGTEHHETVLDSADSLAILPLIDRVLDEPMADPSILPTYLVARFARQHVTVALGGDGGDELFAGYDTFRALAVSQIYNVAVPGFLDRYFIKPAIRRFPVSTSNFSLDFVARQFLRGVKVPEAERLWRWLGAFNPEELSTLLTPDVLKLIDYEHLYADICGLCSKVSAEGTVNRDIHGLIKTYLQDGILTKVDRATMACSLEARSPLLDVNLVELANSIPGHLKRTRGNRLKYIFKLALRGMVPEGILRRRKKGFGLPLAAWLRGPLREPLRDCLSESRLKNQGMFRPEAVRVLLDEHETGRANHRKPLWTLFMFQRWLDNWGHDNGSGGHEIPLTVSSNGSTTASGKELSLGVLA